MWISYTNTESKRHSMQWRHSSSLKAKTFKQASSVRKIMATIFWDRKGILLIDFLEHELTINLLTPNDDFSGRTAPLTSKCCILYIYSTNIGTEYFKHRIYSMFFPLQNAVCFINLTYLVPVLFTFYIQGVLKLKK